MTLSGRVDDLEAAVTSLEGQILALPTQSDLTDFTQTITGRLNTLEESISSQGDNIAMLIQSFSNLKDTILSVNSAFDVHTGQSTGDGVHGH